MFLSIIIPIYNDEKFLEECLDSCLNQDIPYEDYEIICVDDGSTDKTPEILRRYSEVYRNIVLLWKAHGTGNGRIMGLEKSSGDYIWFIDHDDYIHDNILAGFKAKIQESGCERLVFDGYSFTGTLTDEEQLAMKNNTLRSNCLGNRDGAVWTSIIKKSFLEDHGISPRTPRLHGRGSGCSSDTFFIYELQREGIRDCLWDGIPVYYYRQHPGSERSITNPKYDKERIYGQIKLARFVKDDYDEAIRTNGVASSFLFMKRAQWTRIASLAIATKPRAIYQEGRRMMKEEGIFPAEIPKDDDYNVMVCIKNHNGMGVLRSIGYYYSTYPWGLTLYRATFVKTFFSRFLRKNTFVGKLLDLRKRIK